MGRARLSVWGARLLSCLLGRWFAWSGRGEAGCAIGEKGAWMRGRGCERKAKGGGGGAELGRKADRGCGRGVCATSGLIHFIKARGCMYSVCLVCGGRLPSSVRAGVRRG